MMPATRCAQQSKKNHTLTKPRKTNQNHNSALLTRTRKHSIVYQPITLWSNNYNSQNSTGAPNPGDLLQSNARRFAAAGNSPVRRHPVFYAAFLSKHSPFSLTRNPANTNTNCCKSPSKATIFLLIIPHKYHCVLILLQQMKIFVLPLVIL